jgi:hypothetical protein
MIHITAFGITNGVSIYKIYSGTLCLDRVKPLLSQSFLGAEPSR